MAKNISKSIRISQEVYDYIVKSPGKGFNDQFEKIILDAKEDEPRRKKELERLEKSINEKQRELLRLMNRYRYMEDFYRAVLKMQHELFDLKDGLEKVLHDQDEKETD